MAGALLGKLADALPKPEWMSPPLRREHRACSKEDLRLGDHIYTFRYGQVYAHHGIFAGEGKVVHFTSAKDPSQKCGECQDGKNGVGLVCIDCFLKGGRVHRYNYGVSLAEVPMGPSTMYPSDDVNTVCLRASTLLNDNSDGSSFGVYDLATHNCEDFCLYCKTGLLDPKNGLSQQIRRQPYLRAFSSEEPHACLARADWERRFGGSTVDLERDCPSLTACWKATAVSPMTRFRLKAGRFVHVLPAHREEVRYMLEGPSPSLVWPLEMLLHCYREDNTEPNHFTASGSFSR